MSKVTRKPVTKNNNSSKVAKKEHPFGEAEYGEYQGKPTMSIPLNENRRFTLSFGVNKAKAIVEYYDEIKTFAEKNN